MITFLCGPVCVCVCVLTVDVDSYGPDGGGSQSVLSLAVVAPPLVAANILDLQSFVVQRGVALTVRGSARRLSPTNLHREGEGLVYPANWYSWI